MTISASQQRRIGWQEYDAIQSVVDGVDEVARQQEAKWGVGRLELLVSDDLREKFRRQLRRFNEAVTEHDVERVRQAGAAMRRGWEALDKAAAEAGAPTLDPDIWEIPLSNGRVVALCRGRADAFAAARAGRHIDVWTTEEIARVIEKFPEIALAKQTLPGALVERIRVKCPSEPLPDDLFPDEPAQEDA
jgi:hypothetical protein